MSSGSHIALAEMLVRGCFLLPLVLFLRDSVSFYVELVRDKITCEIVDLCAACELDSSRSHPRGLVAHLTCLRVYLWQSKTTMVAQIAGMNGQFLICSPRVN